MSKPLGKNTDIPGDSVGSHAAYVRQMVNWAETMNGAEQVFDLLFEQDIHVRGLSIRVPDEENAEYLLVLRVDGPDGKRVAFHNADTLLGVVVGTLRRLRHGSMKFKEDEYG